MKREVNHKELSELFYVYEHWLDGRVFYIGKGKDARAFDFSRSEYWWSYVRDRMDEVEVRIIAYFVSEEHAFDFEKNLIEKKVEQGEILVNVTYNLDSDFQSRKPSNVGFTSKIKTLEISNTAEIVRFYNTLKRKVKKKEKIVLFLNSNISMLENLIEKEELVKTFKFKSNISGLPKDELKSFFNLSNNPPDDLDILIIHISLLKRVPFDFDFKKFTTFIASSNALESLKRIKFKLPENGVILEVERNLNGLKLKDLSLRESKLEIKIPNEFLNRNLTTKDKENLSNRFFLLDRKGRQAK